MYTQQTRLLYKVVRNTLYKLVKGTVRALPNEKGDVTASLYIDPGGLWLRQYFNMLLSVGR